MSFVFRLPGIDRVCAHPALPCHLVCCPSRAQLLDCSNHLRFSVVGILRELGSSLGGEENIELPKAAVSRPTEDIANIDASESNIFHMAAKLGESEALL